MKKGSLLLEAVVSIGVLGIIIGIFYPGLVNLIKKSASLRHGSRAAVLLQEGMEVAYSVFLDNWEGWEDGVYHPVVESAGGRAKWTMLPGEQTGVETRFFRAMTVEAVCRHPRTGQAKERCGGGEKADEFSRRVTTTVSWNDAGRNKELTASFLVAKL